VLALAHVRNSRQHSHICHAAFTSATGVLRVGDAGVIQT